MDSTTNTLVWIFFLGAIAYLGFHFSPYQIPQSQIVQGRNTVVTVKADPNGHFVFRGEINDKKVYFLYDTGATTVAVPEKLANKMGLRKGAVQYTQTANGRAISYSTILKKVKVGDIVMTNVLGSISPGFKGNQVLLGMSFLNNIEISQYRGTLKLKARQ